MYVFLHCVSNCGQRTFLANHRAPRQLLSAAGLYSVYLPMRESGSKITGQDAEKRAFQESVDYYFEGGLMVLTAHFLTKRGYCCGNGCRHCPYERDANIVRAGNAGK